MPYTRRDRFVDKAQSIGAGLLYAPASSGDPLKNLGSVLLPDGTLQDGAALTDSGLLDGAAAVSLDGTNDYIETGWKTRTNLCTNPGFELDLAGWTETDADGSLTPSKTLEKARSGSGSMKLVNTDAGDDDRMLAMTVAVKGGETYTVTAYCDQSGFQAGALANRGLFLFDGSAIKESKIEEAKEGWTKHVVSITIAAGKETLQVRLYAPQGTVYWDDILIEKAAESLPFFPTPAQLESGEAGWSGAPHESASDIGPFARGTARTFFGLARRASVSTFDALFASSDDQVICNCTNEGDIHFTPNNFGVTAHWDVDGLLGTDRFFYALVWSVGSSARLYTSSSAGVTNRGEKGLVATPPKSATLRISHPNWAPFHGRLLPFGALLSAPTADQVEELWRQINGTWPRIAVPREFPPDKVAVEGRVNGQLVARWAEDEPLVENVLSDFQKSGEMPGGHKELKAGLARDPRTPWSDLPPFMDLTAYQPGREEVWSGRLEKTPESEGERRLIEIEGAGHQAILNDNKAVIGPGFIDAELSKWGEPSTERRLQLINASIRLMAATSVGYSSKDPEAVAAAIINDFTNVTTVNPDSEAGEAHYDSGGVDIGKVIYDFLGDLAAGGGNAAYENNIALGRTDTFATSPVVGTDHDATAASNQSVSATGPGYRYARVRDRLATSETSGTVLKRIFAWRPKVLGDHSLTPQGTWPNIGFTAKQMLEYAIPLCAAPLTVSSESLEDDGFVIPHAWFSEPGPMSQVVQELTRYGLMDWFVFGDKLFQLRVPGTYGCFWQAYAGPSELKEASVDVERLWESIIVRWQDVDGRTRTAGPPGSGAQVEHESLRITDPDHPAVKYEGTRRDILDLKGIGVEGTAIAAGQGWLEEANELSRSGQATLAHYVLDDKTVYRPAAQVMPGDYVRFPDGSDRSYRKIVAVNYSHGDRKATVDLDAPPEGLRALLERFQADLVRIGYSG